MKNFWLKSKKSFLFSLLALVCLITGVLAVKIINCTPGLRTVKNFLATAMQPVGKTLYIWGGGWNQEDAAAGKTAKHIGVWPQWEEFFNSQNSNYNFCDYAVSKNGVAKIPIPKYIPLGLDCSGYCGWVLYNTFHNKDMEGIGYVFPHTRRISNFVSKGWGTVIAPGDIKDFRAGDIMDKQGHVYIVIGQCSDGSVVLVHSSPPGVHICGTVTPSGNADSEAVRLASHYMRTYFPEFYNKFPQYKYVREAYYLTDFKQLRWNVNGVMKDPDRYTQMSASQVLKDLFNEK